MPAALAAMNVAQAKDAARAWVATEGMALPEFAGAFVHGSLNWLAADAALAATSDVDVIVVLDGTAPPRLGKFNYRGVLLDVSFLPREQIATPEGVLAQYHLASSLAAPSIIADPSGHLTAVHTVVAREYARRVWVERRCEDAAARVLRHLASAARVLRHLASAAAAAPLHDRLTAWLFAAGVSVHVLLVAGLRNPTVRRRYLDARALLARYGQSDFYEMLLEQLGCAGMSQQRAMHHLDALGEGFDAAAAVITTPFFFASDLTPLARPIAIDGSREMIVRGDHREAVFWLVATASRCLQVFHHDAPELLAHFAGGYHELLADLGITSAADLHGRMGQVRAFLPQVQEVAMAIMANNSEIGD